MGIDNELLSGKSDAVIGDLAFSEGFLQYYDTVESLHWDTVKSS